MNIFYLDSDPEKCARYHCDSHVAKMIVESTQMLSTAWHVVGNPPCEIYKLTHLNHPSTKWVRESKNNFIWLWQMAMWLCDEFQYRRDKHHATEIMLSKMKFPPLPNLEFTEPPKAMPDEFKIIGVCSSYRNYYANGKQHLHRWTRRGEPDWLEFFKDEVIES